MATTISQSFDVFKSNLEITDWQTQLVSTRRSNVVSSISNELTLYPDTPSLLIGSYDRHSIIRYLSECDVDVMVVLHYGHNKEWDSPDGTVRALDRFKTILDKSFPYTEKTRDRNCITMKYSEFKLDVVPAFSHEGGYYKIPDTIRKVWVPTNPIEFANKMTQVNKVLNGTFVPLVKMVKAWNRNMGWVLRSFHLECMMYNFYQSYTTNYTYPYMLKEFFAILPSYLLIPTYDPAMGDRVDTYLDNQALTTKRQIAISKANDAKAKSKEAYEDQDKYPIVSIGEWKKLLGEFFPAYG